MVDDTPVSPPVSTVGIPSVPAVAGVSEVSLSVQQRPGPEQEPPSEQKLPSFLPSVAEAVLPKALSPEALSPEALSPEASLPEEVSVDSAWGPLELAAADPPRLLYERMYEPSEQSPILYCERSYVVDSLVADEELAAHLLAELELLQSAWRGRDSSQFVQLASFDHAFETEPDHPPLATLSWKDWQGGAELWVRGVRRSMAPERSAVAPGQFEQSVFAHGALDPHPLDERGSAGPESGASSSGPEDDEAPASQVGTSPPERFESAEESLPPPLDTTLSSEQERSRKPDSGTSWQSPSRSGQYLIHRVEEEASPPPPSSQRVLAGEDLVGALFERMHELLYLPDLAAGASYVLETLEEFIPCAGALIHGFDADSKTYSVLCCIGPQAAQVLHTRTPSAGSHLESASRGQGPLRVSGSVQGLWQTLGLEIERALCISVQQQGRYLGIIELGRAPGEVDFSDTELEAIGYIAEQFADFLADRARLLESEPPPSP